MTTNRWHATVSRTVLVVSLIAASLLAGCASTPQVNSSSAPGVDLGTFQTFSFYSELSTDRAGYHSLVSQQLMFSTRREMEVRGFRFVQDPSEADLLVNFYAHVSDQVRIRSTPDPWVNQSFWNYRRGSYRPWPGHRNWPSHSNVRVDQFSEGRLSVDIIDRKEQMLVWEGVSSRRLTQRTLNDLGPALDDAVHNIFGQFPVPASL